VVALKLLLHYSTVQYSTVQYSSVQDSTVQFSLQDSTVQYSSVQCIVSCALLLLGMDLQALESAAHFPTLFLGLLQLAVRIKG